jgi:hypothetical protein
LDEIVDGIPLRVVVTGSRGKSALTRLLHAGFSACGLSVYGRITGVIPRELSPRKERVIRRGSPAHIREMRWWLSQVPADADAVIVENSAIAPELQSFAPDLVRPTLVVWTTLRADHVEVWGPGREGAARALCLGIPPGVPVAGGAELARWPLPRFFRENGNALRLVKPLEETGEADHRRANLALAELACSLCSVGPEALPAMASLPPDLADFRVLRDGTDELAAAFSANDPESTRNLFAETGWDFGETTLLYHHRPDRDARFGEFQPWIREHPWREVVFTRQRRSFSLSRLGLGLASKSIWNDAIDSPSSFVAWSRGRGRVFACGNVAGWPLEFLKAYAKEARP